MLLADALDHQAIGICTRPELGHDGPCNGYPAETCWQHISTCPGQYRVFTKLDDAEHGARNVDTLTAMLTDGRFYLAGANIHRARDLLTYVPTHWRWSDHRVELSQVARRWIAKFDAGVAASAKVSPAEVMADQRLVPVGTFKDKMAAARLMRAACEDADLILRDLTRTGLCPTPNQRMVMEQVKTNLTQAIHAAKSTGIDRAGDVTGRS